MPHLFSYGALQEEAVQLSTFGRVLHGQQDGLIGFEQTLLRIDDLRFVAASGKADHAIVRFNGRQDSRVRGMVFELTDRERANADRRLRARGVRAYLHDACFGEASMGLR